MPVPALKSMAKKAGKSTKDAERYWKDAKKSAGKKGVKNKYAYMMGIVKKRLGSEDRERLMFKSKQLNEQLKGTEPVQTTEETSEESQLKSIAARYAPSRPRRIPNKPSMSFWNSLNEALGKVTEGTFEPRDLRQSPPEKGLGIHKVGDPETEKGPSKQSRRKQLEKKVLIGYDESGKPIYRIPERKSKIRSKFYGGPRAGGGPRA